MQNKVLNGLVYGICEIYIDDVLIASEAAGFIFQHFGRFGTPDVIHTDQGPAFRNERFSELSRLSQVGHSFATAYSKEENGFVEHQEVMRHFFDARVHNKWSYEKLPMVQRIMNTVEKTSTKLILNNSIRLSNRILAPDSANPLVE